MQGKRGEGKEVTKGKLYKTYGRERKYKKKRNGKRKRSRKVIKSKKI